MTTATDCTAGGIVTEPRQVREARAASIEAYLRHALTRAPQTTRQLADCAPDVPHRFVNWCGRPGCAGHLEPIIWYRMRGQDMQRVLVRWERNGLARRVVVDGWQSHLWALATDGAA